LTVGRPNAPLIFSAVWLNFWLRLDSPFNVNSLHGLWILPVARLIGFPLYAITGQYKGLTRFVGSLALHCLSGRNFLLVLLRAFVCPMLQLPPPPQSSWLLLWLLLTSFSGAVNFALRDLFVNPSEHSSSCAYPHGHVLSCH
jgi:hypothetical protein